MCRKKRCNWIDVASTCTRDHLSFPREMYQVSRTRMVFGKVESRWNVKGPRGFLRLYFNCSVLRHTYFLAVAGFLYRISISLC